MILFLDTEFTDLGTTPSLLSVGITGMETDFYAEVTDKNRLAKASRFVADTVLPQFGQLPGAAHTYTDLAEKLARFIEQEIDKLSSGETLKIAYDFDTDWRLVLRAIQDAKTPTSKSAIDRIKPINIFKLSGSTAGEQASQEYFDEHLLSPIRQHHALRDAKALEIAFHAATSALQVQSGLTPQSAEATSLRRQELKRPSHL